ncbi:DNA polymerase V subunit UmuC [Thiomicrorhabdus immobilis]|uniref:DNA polymerase V subunit UmuC n=1 Tax=Thiomicrorhabdus immobilis TaxID=2791037 RepID=A0ABM7MFC0_9GAMM|nr:Y-family DNA polymerase [Thiomicrorhabdus immobilis]BCN94141.1 DNA polymerase V subunit UmuC [Thiomicrorhabdus immobilis]
MPTYALVDGNSFYASCQIAFQPGLVNRPVVVLSNNDGCIVAANQIAKNLDLQHVKPNSLGQGGYYAATADSMMFQPFFKVAPILKRFDTAVFSSNYELYADMSQRMHAISAQFASRQEIYSIDESFLDFTGIDKQRLNQHATQMKERILQWIGIPVAVGIGSSKTQAKLANHLAKKLPDCHGVFDLSQLSEHTRNTLYQTIKVGAVWGVGKRLNKQLNAAGINTVYDLVCLDQKTLKRKFSVNIERMVLELNGQACLSFEEIPGNKQNIVSSRSFSRNVTEFNTMREAVSSYTATAAEKLRQQHGTCKAISVFITTPPYQTQLPQYRNQQTIPLVYPSDSTILLTKVALRALQKIWRPGYEYQKASVMLLNIQEKQSLQTDLFAPNPQYSGNPKSDNLMKTLDNINRKMGKNTLKLASSGLHNQSWKMNRNLMSARYTTRWDELLTVTAK